MTRSLLLLALLLTACVEPAAEEEPPPVEPQALPTVQGLQPSVDLDPSDDVAEYAMTVREGSVELVAGQMVEAFTYDGMSPGPLLQVRRGQLMRVHVTNDLDEPTTVHWHGLRIDVAMDGVVMGNIPAIAPGDTFVYEFTPPDAGTFWFHPHVRSNVQVEAGLYGALVVHEDAALAPSVDADRIFVLDDVLLEDGVIAEESSNHMVQMHGRFGNTLLVNGQEDPLSIDLRPDGVERWRLVNTANARTMVFRFPGLSVREVGADGGLWPQEWTRSIDELTLPVGARAELEVRLDGDEGSLEQVVLALDANNDVIEVPVDRALVTLDGDAAASDASGFTADPPMALPDVDGADEHVLAVSAVNGADGVTWMLNGRAWPEASDWVVDQNVPVIIEVQNDLGPEHPFHVHGQFFSVLERDGAPADERGLWDTVLVRGGTTVRIATDFSNPGTWMVHCHILEHAERGMMTTVEVVP